MHTKVNEMSKQINGIHYQHDLELQQKLMVGTNQLQIRAAAFIGIFFVEFLQLNCQYFTQSCEQSWKEKLKCLEQRTKMDCNAYQSTIEELKRYAFSKNEVTIQNISFLYSC